QLNAGITLSSDQEKALRPQVEASFQAIRDLSAKVAADRGQRQNAGGDGGGRRGGRGRGADPNSLAALQVGPAADEMKKINDDMLAKIMAALKPEQQAAFKKYLNAQIKKAGGFGALKVTMEEAGAPLTPEQEPQIQGFYNDDAQQRAQLMRESQGKPDPAKLADVDKATMGKVVKVLTAAQRQALLASRTAKPQ
ncbi:MAG TPA: Spy/CpxP family protein refolding chaperone, partial [Terriglobia bacterium]|nr:Spy/CpxP family protein refolding chaperone [Terriglobia bacterium]